MKTISTVRKLEIDNNELIVIMNSLIKYIELDVKNGKGKELFNLVGFKQTYNKQLEIIEDIANIVGTPNKVASLEVKIEGILKERKNYEHSGTEYKEE